MTCIVGLKSTKHDRIYIGGDTMGVGGYSKTYRVDGKVFKKNDMIFGFTSSYRMGQILRYTFNAPARPENVDDMTYLVANFIPALMEAYKSGGFLTKANEASYGGTFLLGYNKELYRIDNDFQVGIPELGYDSCGCGEEFAKGCMFALNTDLQMRPEDKIIRCLDAAATHSAGVGGRFEIVDI